LRHSRTPASSTQRPFEICAALHSGFLRRPAFAARGPIGTIAFEVGFIGGGDYLLQMTISNTFFHIAMAYAILRHNGVDVGKMDFLGSINLVDA